MKRLSSFFEKKAEALKPEIVDGVSQDKIKTINGFAILKPGFTEYQTEFAKLLNDDGWEIINQKEGKLTWEQACELYKNCKEQPFYGKLCDYMCNTPCICYGCYKDCEDPIKDMKDLKDKVREMWGRDEMRNAMHCASSKHKVNKEACLCMIECMNEMLNENFEAQADIKTLIIAELKSLFAEEVNAFYQYFIAKNFLVGRERPSIEKKFEEFAMDELEDHGGKLLKRLNELDADVSELRQLYDLNNIAKNKFIVPSIQFETEIELELNMQAEEGAINHYKDAIKITEDIDPVTNVMLKEILADEEEHLTELRDFLNDITGKKECDGCCGSCNCQPEPVAVQATTEEPTLATVSDFDDF